MARFVTLVFAVAAYALFFATFLSLIAFVGDFGGVPRTVDRGPAAPVGVAIAADLGLIALFGVQHSVMARPSFKRRWTRLVPPVAERSVYVLAASLVLIALFAFWRPLPGTVWRVDAAWGAGLLWAVFAAGWLIVLLSTFLISHFELFGLQQAWLNLRRRTAESPRFHTPLLYRIVRHPLYSGFIIAFWATPVMSWGHLLLAAGMTAYILIAIPHEERDLVGVFGSEYERYREGVGMLAPRLRKVGE